jgi:hypothetical protein
MSVRQVPSKIDAIETPADRKTDAALGLVDSRDRRNDDFPGEDRRLLREARIGASPDAIRRFRP